MKYAAPLYPVIIIALGALFFTGCQKPTEACFDYSPSRVTTKTEVQFNAACSQNTQFYTWSFGDNTTDSTLAYEATTMHRFAMPGTYTVTLHAGAKCGTGKFWFNKWEAQRTITVYEAP